MLAQIEWRNLLRDAANKARASNPCYCSAFLHKGDTGHDWQCPIHWAAITIAREMKVAARAVEVQTCKLTKRASI